MKSIKEIEIILSLNDWIKSIDSYRALLRKKRIYVEYGFDNDVKIGAKSISSIENRNWEYCVCYFSDLDGHMTAFGLKI